MMIFRNTSHAKFKIFAVLISLVFGCTYKPNMLDGTSIQATMMPSQVLEGSTSQPANFGSKPTSTDEVEEIIPSVTAESSTVTPEPTVTLRPLKPENCAQVKIVDDLPSTARQGGVLVLINQLNHNGSGYLLDLSSGEKTELPITENNSVLEAAVNYSRTKLACWIRGDTGNSLMLMGPDGKIEKTVELSTVEPAVVSSGFFRWFEGWLDNERLVIGYQDETSMSSYSLIFNPLSTGQELFQNDFPGIYLAHLPGFSWEKNNFSRVVYHSSLHYALYPTWPDSLVFWDMQFGQEIKALSGLSHIITAQPAWSPDGKSFIFDRFSSMQGYPEDNTNRNIYLFSVDGNIEQLTSYTNRRAGAFIHFTWSPNGKMIAFWNTEGRIFSDGNSYELSTLDIFSREGQDHCLTAFWSNFGQAIKAPVWSPDGRYLAVFARLEESDAKGWTVLLDTVEQKAYRVAQGVYPAGWMSPPGEEK